ncbi:MAG: cadherin-like domain-containing protein [Oscillospiraceae bacterium]|nr:cadherin-like domain-containing protein [Oscillospiraceae bacterium]
MFRSTILPLLLACLVLASPVAAAEAAEPAFAGACITSLPDQGQVLLGSRILRPGDVLTAEQWAQIVFCPAPSGKAQEQLRYLPVFSGQIGPERTITLGRSGRSDVPPTAEDAEFETYRNLPCEGMLRFSDPEGEQLAFTLTAQPRRGSVILRPDGSFLYTPERNKVGTDSFRFTVTDLAGNVSREATVKIQIRKPTEELYYSDTAGLPCRFSAEWLRQTGIFSGERLSGQLCFSPEQEVTRGQFLAMLMETLRMPVDHSQGERQFLEDAPPWLRPYLAAALRAGIITSDPEAAPFRSDDPISGREAREMIRLALGYALPTALTGTGAIAAWASDALPVEMLEMLPSGQTPLTRAEAAQVLYALSQLKAPGLSLFFF